jgi:hypothetical protein
MTHALVDVLGEKSIPIMEEHAVGVISGDGFSGLRHGPRRRDIDMQEPSARMLNHHKDIEEAEGRRDCHAEVTRYNTLSMIADKCGPALRVTAFAWAADAVTGHVCAHSSWRDPQTEFAQEFVGDAFLPPGGILQGHATDDGLQVPGQGRSPRFGLPPPKESKALAVLTDEGHRFHDHQHPAPVEEAAEPDQCHASGVVGVSGFDLAFLILRQLFTQKEIFRCQGRCRSQAQHEKTRSIEQNYQQCIRHLTEGVDEGTKAPHKNLIRLSCQRFSLPIVPSLSGRVQGELAGRHLDLSVSGAHSIMLKYERLLFLRTTAVP